MTDEQTKRIAQLRELIPQYKQNVLTVTLADADKQQSLDGVE